MKSMKKDQGKEKDSEQSRKSKKKQNPTKQKVGFFNYNI